MRSPWPEREPRVRISVDKRLLFRVLTLCGIFIFDIVVPARLVEDLSLVSLLLPLLL